MNRLLKEVKDFEFEQYNPRKDIPRSGLSITSLDGTLNGIDLDSIVEYNKENDVHYTDLDFNTVTDVYHKSEEIQKVVKSQELSWQITHITFI